MNKQYRAVPAMLVFALRGTFAVLAIGAIYNSVCLAGSKDKTGTAPSKTSGTDSKQGNGASTPTTGTPQLTFLPRTLCTAEVSGLHVGSQAITFDSILLSYETGEPKRFLNEALTTLANELRRSSTALTGRCKSDVTLFNHRARISFAFIDDFVTPPQIVRVLAGSFPPPAEGSTRLVADGSMFTINLYRDWTPQIATTVTGTLAPSPLQSAFQQFVGSVSGGASKSAVAPAPAALSGVTQASAHMLTEDQQGALNLYYSKNPELQNQIKDLANSEFELESRLPGWQTPPPTKFGLPEALSAGFSKEAILAIGTLPKKTTIKVVVTQVAFPSGWKAAQLTVNDTADVKSYLTYESTKSRLNAAASGLKNVPPSGFSKLNEPFVDLFESGKCQSLKAGPYSDKTTSPITPSPITPGTISTSTSTGNAGACQQSLDALQHEEMTSPEKYRDSKDAPLSASEVDTINVLHSMYSGIVTAASSDPAPASLQVPYNYAPLTRWSFGLGAGAMGLYWHRQVKTGTPPTDDPPSGAFTSANAYRSFSRYDETSTVPSRTETNRLVFGVVLTPSPGALLGYSYELQSIRSVTLNVGYAVMSSTILDGTKTKRGALGAAIIGVGYSLGQ